MATLRDRLVGLPRPAKFGLMLVSDLFAIELALCFAYLLHYGALFASSVTFYGYAVVGMPLVSLPLFYYFGLYSAVIRFQGAQMVTSVGKALVASLVLAYLCLLLVGISLRWEPAVVYALTAFLLVGGSRFYMRSFLQPMRARHRQRKPVIVYGAGIAGVQTVASLSNALEYRPVAFVDDEPTLQGKRVSGLHVHKPGMLAELIDRYSVNTVVLAMPSVPRAQRHSIVEQLEHLNIKVKTLPGVAELVAGTARVDELRVVQIEDLLGRDPVAPVPYLLGMRVMGKRVMVTGAGGSIGGELARQIVRNEPAVLVLYELSEWALYEIERQLRGMNHEVTLVPVLGDVADRGALERTMREHGVQTVYHAAAYKHVPLIEDNLLAGVRNNVLGTHCAVEAALATGAESFTLISTDKAVRPANVMGATKRCAELVLQCADQQLRQSGQAGPVFSMVRFGNVLGSSGSVVPLFREQIRRGGPVTVTHPEIIRYFMTASEAANLVIQAGAMAEGGEVFVLDMGEPVKIAEMAKRMIRLAGYEVRDAEKTPQGDIEIRYTGLRPGEKLYEELLIGGDVAGTQHSKIMRTREACPDWPTLKTCLDTLTEACEKQQPTSAMQVLTELVADYRPSQELASDTRDPKRIVQKAT